jgi:hypothetical protein
MSASAGRLKMNELESWLQRVLVPVEPSERLAQKLKARLVTLRRAGPADGWMILGLVLTVVVLLVAWMGITLRVALGILALLGLVNGGPRNKSRQSSVVGRQ